MIAVKYTNAAGWSATVTNPAVNSDASDKCGIFVGTAAAAKAAVRPRARRSATKPSS